MVRSLGCWARRWVVVAVLAVLVLGVGAAVAVGGPVLEVDSFADTTVAPGGTLDYFVQITNVGDAPTDGSPLTFDVSLPTGVSAVSVTDLSFPHWDCSSVVVGASTMHCVYAHVMDPHSGTRGTGLEVQVSVAGDASGMLTSSFTVAGGGAPSTSTVDPTRVTPTLPGFGVDGFDAQLSAGPGGGPFTQAGGHPFGLSTSIVFNTLTNPRSALGEVWPVEQPKDITVTFPPGVVIDPAAPSVKCTSAQLASGDFSAITQCPADSQIGSAIVISSNGQMFGPPMPVYSIVPPAGTPARFGMNVSGSVVTLDGGVNAAGGYSLRGSVRNAPDGLAVAATELTLWGTPADPAHDVERSCPNELPVSSAGPSCTADPPLRALLRMPTFCTAPGQGLATMLSTDSWVHPGVFVTASSTTHELPGFPAAPADWGPVVGTSGCGAVPFSASLLGTPDVPAAGGPSGFSFDVAVPQNVLDPDTLAVSDLRSAVVTLPEGVRTSASVADGLQGCSPAEIGLGSEADSSCPGASKIGTVTIDTPLLDTPLTGSIYLATPHENPFGSLLAVYVVARGSGVVVKLAGEVVPDPQTGRLTTTFEDQPQLPFSRLHLAFKDGPRAPLSVPNRCGTYVTHAVLSGWNGKTVTSDSPFVVSGDGHGARCAAPVFAPGFSAGGTSVRAGGHTSLLVHVTRADTDQDLAGLQVNTPKGLTGKIAGVPLCAPGPAASGSCPAGSQIGSVLTGSGAGPDPFYLPGKVFLTGPYKSAPFGLSIVVPAIAGPFDLGVVVVRAQVQVDRHTAQLHVVSDPLPRILQGIPLQIKDIRVTVDRPGFMLNPTDCTPRHLSAIITSNQGLVAHRRQRFQVGGCARLPLAPKLTIAVGGKGHDRRGASIPLTTTLTQTRGQANLRSVSVSLPGILNARLGVVSNACTQAQYDAGRCQQARAGSAVAVTPLLSKPLRGSVYFVKDPTKPAGALPNLVVALRGQIAFDLIGHITIPNGNRLATTFNAIPDTPITSFGLSLVSGAHGPLGTTANLCTDRARHAAAAIAMHGQNGLSIHRHQLLIIHGCPTRRH